MPRDLAGGCNFFGPKEGARDRFTDDAFRAFPPSYTPYRGPSVSISAAHPDAGVAIGEQGEDLELEIRKAAIAARNQDGAFNEADATRAKRDGYRMRLSLYRMLKGVDTDDDTLLAQLVRAGRSEGSTDVRSAEALEKLQQVIGDLGTPAGAPPRISAPLPIDLVAAEERARSAQSKLVETMSPIYTFMFGNSSALAAEAGGRKSVEQASAAAARLTESLHESGRHIEKINRHIFHRDQALADQALAEMQEKLEAAIAFFGWKVHVLPLLSSAIALRDAIEVHTEKARALVDTVYWMLKRVWQVEALSGAVFDYERAAHHFSSMVFLEERFRRGEIAVAAEIQVLREQLAHDADLLEMGSSEQQELFSMLQTTRLNSRELLAKVADLESVIKELSELCMFVKPQLGDFAEVFEVATCLERLRAGTRCIAAAAETLDHAIEHTQERRHALDMDLAFALQKVRESLEPTLPTDEEVEDDPRVMEVFDLLGGEGELE